MTTANAFDLTPDAPSPVVVQQVMQVGRGHRGNLYAAPEPPRRRRPSGKSIALVGAVAAVVGAAGTTIMVVRHDDDPKPTRAVVVAPTKPAPRPKPKPPAYRADGTTYTGSGCDARAVTGKAAPLVSNQGATVGTIEVLVSPTCGMLFPRFIHVPRSRNEKWHGNVHFVVVRKGREYDVPVLNAVDPLFGPGMQIPVDACVDLRAYIAETSYEVTQAVLIKHICLPAG
jgi:hypothetical protein